MFLIIFYNSTTVKIIKSSGLQLIRCHFKMAISKSESIRLFREGSTSHEKLNLTLTIISTYLYTVIIAKESTRMEGAHFRFTPRQHQGLISPHQHHRFHLLVSRDSHSDMTGLWNYSPKLKRRKFQFLMSLHLHLNLGSCA